MLTEIPYDGDRALAIKTGMAVDFNTPLYKGSTKREERIEVASLLAIHPQTIFTHLKKNVGDTVKKGELLAEKKSFFGQKHIVSDLDGVITEVDHIEGIVLLETQSDEFVETCWFTGTIQAITKTHISLKVGSHQTVEVKHIERDFGGSVWLMHSHTDNAPASPVALAEKFTTYDIAKLEALGGTGFIATYAFTGETILPHTEFKLKNGYEDAAKLTLPYCITQAHHSTIIFYSP